MRFASFTLPAPSGIFGATELMSKPGSRRILGGIGFMVLGVSLLPVMNSFAKSLASEFWLWQVVWARFAGHLLWLSLMFAPRLGMSPFRTRHVRGQLARGAIFFLSNACFIAALPLVPLASASAIMFTTPLVVTVLSVFMLGERVGPLRLLAVIVGFTGAMVIIRPGADAFNAWTLMILVSAGCFGLYQVWTRKLAEHDRPETLVVYTALVGALATTLFVPWFARAPDTAFQWFAFAGVGLIGGLAQFCIVQALARGPASVISPIGYAELISATVLGAVIFGELPDSPTWLGAGLIIGSGLFIAYRER